MSKILSEFQIQYLKINETTKEPEWVKETIYYHGDLREIDLELDWRFKEISGKRKGVIFIRLVDQDNMNWVFKI